MSLLNRNRLLDNSADCVRNVFISMPFLHIVTCVSTSFVECYSFVRRCWKNIAESLDNQLPASPHQPDNFLFLKRTFGQNMAAEKPFLPQYLFKKWKFLQHADDVC